MAETFFIADLHLGHRNIITFECLKEHRNFPTVEAHDEALISNWNKVVRPPDEVWVLGDVAFGTSNLEKVALLNGSKRLVMGNHDRCFHAERLLKYFKRLYGAADWHHYILTHIPIHPCQFYRYKVNIHGHMHTEKVTRASAPDFRSYPDNRYLCVSAEQVNMRPISSDEVIKTLKERGL